MKSMINSFRCHIPLHRVSLIAVIAACIPFPCNLVAQDVDAPDQQIAFRIEPPFAWNRTDRYQAPDYDSFFPDDVEAGRQLDLMLQGKLKATSADQRLALIRQGFRHTSLHRTTLLGRVGNEFVWNQNPQDPRAIELLYHASASPNADVAHYALYHGPTVVADRTPNLVRMLMERFHLFHGEIQNRIAWGMKTYGDKEQTRRLLLDLLDQHQTLDESTICTTIDTYQTVFDSTAPNPERFDGVGKWLIAFHRTDLSSSHPHAARILRDDLNHISLSNQNLKLIDFVTRVADGHETAVALVEGVRSRVVLERFLRTRVSYQIDFNELLVPEALQKYRLREFAKHLPQGLPERALPAYTRPPSAEVYAYQADKFIAPNFEEFFADDAVAGEELDRIFNNRNSIELTDRELLDLFRRGFRRSSQSPNSLFSWISSALGWPGDPLLTEIMYQAVDSTAPQDVYNYAIYYGFGLGVPKTHNILEATFRVFMAPPFDRTTNGNMRSRILWGLGQHADDKYFMATLFESALREHALLSDAALFQAAAAYKQLTGDPVQNAADFASRGLFVVIAQDSKSDSVDSCIQRLKERIGQSEHVVDSKCISLDEQTIAIVLARGQVGQHWVIDQLQTEPKFNLLVIELLTRDLIENSKNDALREFEEHLPANESK